MNIVERPCDFARPPHKRYHNSLPRTCLERALEHCGGGFPPFILGPIARKPPGTNYAKGSENVMPGPRPLPIALTHRQRETLEHLTRRTSSAQGLVRRARIVLAAAAEGHNNEHIARMLGINRETARLWRRAWLDAAE